MLQAVDLTLFGLLLITNFSLGMYFSCRKRSTRGDSISAKAEIFLGGRMLKVLPLAASSVASLFSATGLVGFTAHFYAYGWHMAWGFCMPLLCIPLATRVFVPVLYGAGVTSIFEYIRLRFNTTISLTACAIYIFLTQSIGAISIFAASLTLVTVFKVPLFWCSLLIGLSGTLYTALGGLRGVVWTDCMQFLFILIAPVTIIANIIIDSLRANSAVQPLSDLNLGAYIADFRLDLTNDENFWSCFFGTTAAAIYRLCLDQMVAQRLLASRTLQEARRTAFTSTILLFLLYTAGFFMGVALTIWFRGCDPTLLGEIQSMDQILPYYINTYLVHIPGFVGLFLAGVVSAATSTISSMVNSQATILYVDVISPRYKNADQHVLWITRGTALLFGATMTIYSTLCVYMGSVTRIFMMVNTGLTAPFVGLCLLAVLFPFVHSKGAGVATLITVVYQLCHTANIIRTGRRPLQMPVSLDYCPVNRSATAPQDTFVLFRISYLWSSVLAILATVTIGILLSAVTGEMSKTEQPGLSSDLITRMWRKPQQASIGQTQENLNTKKLQEAKHKNQDEVENLLADIEETVV
ncbi:sodium-coupled monocarboxylate transporter 2-like isoform X2 [Amblyomma americanum]